MNPWGPVRSRRLLRAFLLDALVAFATFGTCLADEGRIPVYQPTTISQPGSYIVTADISVASGVAIIIAAPRVLLDLNGHSLSMASTSSGNYVIRLVAGADDVWISNGRVLGGYVGVLRNEPGNDLSLHLEGLTFEGQGFRGVNVGPARHFEARHCQLVRGTLAAGSCGIFAGNSTVPVDSAFLYQNTLGGWDRGAQVIGDRGVQIRNNTLSSNSVGIETFSASLPGGGLLIEGNTVASSSSSAILAGGIVRNNVVRDAQGDGIGAGSSGTILAENIVTAAGLSNSSTSAGVFVPQDRVLVDRNLVESSGAASCGILFYSFASPGIVGSSYRDNMLRNNPAGGVCFNNATATDEGGNIP